VADPSDEVVCPVAEPLSEAPAALRCDVMLTAYERHLSIPRAEEVFTVCSAVECTHATCDALGALLRSGEPSLLHDIGGGVWSEERKPVPIPGSSETVALEHVESFVTELRLTAMAWFRSTQHERFDLGGCEPGDFDRTRTPYGVPDDNHWAVADTVECCSCPVDEVVALFVKRWSHAFVSESRKVIGED